jgi:hypothetical protein
VLADQADVLALDGEIGAGFRGAGEGRIGIGREE